MSAGQNQGTLDVDALRTTLTTLINNNIALAQSGSDVDLFKKAYLYFGTICDEPRDDAEYRVANQVTAQLDSLKAELAPMLSAYPSLQASFMNLKHLVTAPNPTDKTYADKVTGSWFNKETFIDDDYGNTVLTGDSYIYAPQYQWLHTEIQRAMYAGEDTLWWYGCSTPYPPFPTYHIDDELIGSRILSWMQFDYGSDGTLYWAVNNSSNSSKLWEGAVGFNGAMGDGSLVYPAKKFSLMQPVSTLRLESIREGQEDYEYLWMIRQAIEQYNEENGTDYDPEELMASLYSDLYNGMVPQRENSEYFAEHRAEILQLLEQFTKAPGDAISVLTAKV